MIERLCPHIKQPCKALDMASALTWNKLISRPIEVLYLQCLMEVLLLQICVGGPLSQVLAGTPLSRVLVVNLLSQLVMWASVFQLLVACLFLSLVHWRLAHAMDC